MSSVLSEKFNIEDNCSEENLLEAKIALLLQFIATVCFSFMNVLCKHVYIQNPNVNGFDYLLIRGISIAVLSIIQVIYCKVNIFTIQPEYKTTVYAYAIVGGSGVFAFYFGFKFIPASIGILIFYINPVLIAAVAPFILNEVLTKEKVIVVLGSFAGAAILLLHKNILPGDTDHYYLGAILTFVTCCTGTCMSLISRMVAGKIHYSICPFYYCFYCMLVLFLMLVADYSMFNIEKLSLYDLSMFLLSGVFGFVGGNIRFVAFQYEEASKVAPFGYFEVFIVLLFDIFAFKYSFVLTDIIGGFFIIFCLLFPVVHKLYQERKKSRS